MSREMNTSQFGEFILDGRLRELRRGDAPITMPGKAFDLLAYMGRQSRPAVDQG